MKFRALIRSGAVSIRVPSRSKTMVRGGAISRRLASRPQRRKGQAFPAGNNQVSADSPRDFGPRSVVNAVPDPKTRLIVRPGTAARQGSWAREFGRTETPGGGAR